ncbi:MAG TPA: 6-phosphogluconolactonase [Bryobacteraceae bacterium]|nr:6-phosphogluconolactonase [Bryobacteraceae bacterium]
MNRYPDARAAAEACGKRILTLLGEAIERNGRATLAISGGSSPKLMFESFAKTTFAWDRLHVFWVDERGVPPDDPQSNFKLANDAWLAPARFPAANLHRIQAELDAATAAKLYVDEIRAALPGKTPEFDVIHQGMGPDGHTASLFPGEPLIEDRQGIAAAVWVEKFKQWRITLLPAVLIAARHTAMLVTGAEKTPALEAVVHGIYQPLKFPAQIVARHARDAAWFLDF